MPNFVTSDMWSAYKTAGLFLVTTNCTVKKSSKALVMGRGIARQAQDRFPGLDVALGRQILALCGNLGRYDPLVSPRWPVMKLGIFQVKRHYGRPADLKIIEGSTINLKEWAFAHPGIVIHLNFPGIGNGGLPSGIVRPFLEPLPDNVYIWEYAIGRSKGFYEPD